MHRAATILPWLVGPSVDGRINEV